MNETRNNEANEANEATEGSTMSYDPAADGEQAAKLDNAIAKQADIIIGREKLTADQATHLRNTMQDARTEAEHDGYGGYDAAIEAAVNWLRS